MATIRNRNTNWQVQVRRKGHPMQTKSYLTKADAVRWARQTEVELDATVLKVDTRVLERTTICPNKRSLGTGCGSPKKLTPISQKRTSASPLIRQGKNCFVDPAGGSIRFGSAAISARVQMSSNADQLELISTRLIVEQLPTKWEEFEARALPNGSDSMVKKITVVMFISSI